MLFRYLGYAPKWVRYATSAPEHPDLPIDLLKPEACPPGSQKESFAKSGFGQVRLTSQVLPIDFAVRTGGCPKSGFRQVRLTSQVLPIDFAVGTRGCPS